MQCGERGRCDVRGRDGCDVRGRGRGGCDVRERGWV